MWPDDESIINISIPVSGLVCGLFYSFHLEVFHVKVGDVWREWKTLGDTVCLLVELAVDTEVVKFETLTAVTHLLITKYILKLTGICGFCNVNICT